jgi:dTDP-4-dehydrorhamnose reductase
MKTIVLGGTGLLGTELKKLDQDLVCLGSHECNISSQHELATLFKYPKGFDTIILAAAELTTAPNLALITTNIIGASNVARACLIAGKRLVYISSDYVYPGTLGNYKETDPVLPVNNYAWSKLGGECAVRMVENHLIIRTSFGPSNFPHEHPYNNLWTSKDYVDVIAPMILEASKSDLTGIINIGTEKKTMLDYARRRNPDITGKPLTDNSSPRDSSLNLDKWKSFHKSIQPAESAETES